MKSEIIEAEYWSGGTGTVGACLTWNENDGFKVRIGNVPRPLTLTPEDLDDPVIPEEQLRDWGAKVTVEHAIGIFGRRIWSENIRRHLHETRTTFMYDGKDYPIERLPR